MHPMWVLKYYGLYYFKCLGNTKTNLLPYLVMNKTLAERQFGLLLTPTKHPSQVPTL